MAEPIGALRAELSASAAAFEKDMGRARKAVRGESNKMRRSFSMLNKSGTNLTRSIFRLRNAAIVASVGGLAALTRRAISTADNIAKTADKLGVGVEALQELRHAAERAGVPLQTFDMAIQRFTRRAGEAAQGTGEAKDALAQLGIQLTDSQGQMRPTEDLLGDVADAFTRIEDPAQRLRIAFKLFDSEGVAMVNMLRDGAAGIDRMRERARALGIVISEDMVRRAEKANDELDDLADVFKVAGTNLALEFMPVLQELARIMTDPAFINGIRDMGQETKNALKWLVDNQDTVIRVLGAVTGFMLGAKAGGVFGSKGKMGGALGGAVTGALGPEVMQALGMMGIAPAQAGGATGGGQGGQDTGFVPSVAGTPGAPITFGGPQSEADKVIETLKHEQKLLGMTNEQRQVANALKAAGVDLDTQQGQKISMLVESIHSQTEALEKQELQQEQLTAAAHNFASQMTGALMAVIVGGQEVQEVLKAMVAQLAAAVVQAIIFKAIMTALGMPTAGAGGGGSLLGGLFGFQHGGSFQVPGSGGMDSQLVAFRATPGERVNVETPGQQGSGASVPQTVNINLPRERQTWGRRDLENIVEGLNKVARDGWVVRVQQA